MGSATSPRSEKPLRNTAMNGLTCPDDGAILDLHQPHEDRPDRILGTCPECHETFLLARSDQPEGWEITGRIDWPKPDVEPVTTATTGTRDSKAGDGGFINPSLGL